MAIEGPIGAVLFGSPENAALTVVIIGVFVKALLAWCNHGKEFDARLTIRSSIMGILGGYAIVFASLTVPPAVGVQPAPIDIPHVIAGIMTVIGTDKVAKDVGRVVKRGGTPNPEAAL